MGLHAQLSGGAYGPGKSWPSPLWAELGPQVLVLGWAMDPILLIRLIYGLSLNFFYRKPKAWPDLYNLSCSLMTNFSNQVMGQHVCVDRVWAVTLGMC